MNISRKQKGDLGAIITIEITPQDYQPRVDASIRNYSKNANMPGFRPGHVPAGIIRKKYGKEVLVEELNRLLSEELLNYLKDNNINVLGSPLPVDNSNQLTFEEGNNFSFDYEIGLAPEINVKVPENKVTFYTVMVDDKMIDDDINDLRRRYGKFSNSETAEESSILYGDFAELDEKGELKADGVTNTTSLSIEMIRNDSEQKKFIGTKKDDVINFNPMMAFGNETEVAAMLRIDKKSPALNSDYRFTTKTVNKIEKADLNQEFFDKIFGPGVVTSEDEFRKKISESIARDFEKESNKKLQKDMRNAFLEENNLQLPDDFLKRMLKARQDKEINDHDFEHEYYHVAESLRWDLIQNKIAQENSITITNEEMTDAVKMMIAQQFAQYGMPPPENEKMDELVKNYMTKEDNEERLERTLLGHKVFEHLKMNTKLKNSELPYKEFIEKLKEKTAHEHEHHH